MKKLLLLRRLFFLSGKSVTMWENIEIVKHKLDLYSFFSLQEIRKYHHGTEIIYNLRKC